MEQTNTMPAEKINYGVSEQNIYDEVRDYLSQFTSLPIIDGNQNASPPYESVIITMLGRQSKSSPSSSYSLAGQKVRRSTLVTFQVDIYGENAGQVYDAIVTMGLTSFDNNSFVAPCRFLERGRMPFINEQRNYEARYSLDVEFSLFNELSREVTPITSATITIKEVK